MRPWLAPPARGPLEPRAQPPTFSIVIAAYEAAAFVGGAVESALAQTLPPLEVIVSDDGSTDDIEGALAPHRDRITLLRGPNRGPAAARNAAFHAATGEYVVILDADDLFLPERLEAIAELLGVRPDLDVITTDAFMELNGEVVRRLYDESWRFETADQRREILRRNFVFGLAAVRRDALLAVGGMDESGALVGVEDWDLWVRLILGGSLAGLVAEPLARNQLRDASLSSDREGRLAGRIAVLERALGHASIRPAERKTARRAIARNRGELRQRRARRALLETSPAARRAALAAALTAAAGPESLFPRARLRALGWAVAPARARRHALADASASWEGAGGLVHAAAVRRLRVAYYCDAHEIGGSEANVRNLIGALGESVDPVVVAASPAVGEWLGASRPGTETILVRPIRRKRDVRALAAQFTALRRIRPDVLHVSLNGPWSAHWALLMGAALPGTKVVAVENLATPSRSLEQRLLKRLTSRLLAAHVAIGERCADEVAAYTRVDRSSLRVIRNGVPEVEVEPLPRLAEGLVVGSVGRLEHQKAYELLVDALPALPGATAVLVGDGTLREPLLAQARRLGVDDRLVLAGWSEEPRRYLGGFDAFVLPSRFEGLPLALIEAMLAGLPVVATDVGGVAELVVDGETGLIVPPDDVRALTDALARILADPALRERYGGTGRERARAEFTMARVAREFEALYAEVTR